MDIEPKKPKVRIQQTPTGTYYISLPKRLVEEEVKWKLGTTLEFTTLSGSVIAINKSEGKKKQRTDVNL